MSSIRNSFALLLLAALIAPTLTYAKDTPDEQAIRQTLSRYGSALNAADTATIVNRYTDDGVQMAPDAPAAVEREAVNPSGVHVQHTSVIGARRLLNIEIAPS